MTETVGKRYTWQSMRKEKGYASYFKSVTSPPSQGECFHALLDRCPNHAPTRPGHTFRVLFQMGLSLRLLHHLVVVQGVAEILFIGYVVVLGRSAFLSSPVDAGLGEVVVVVAVRGVNQAPSVMCI